MVRPNAGRGEVMGIKLVTVFPGNARLELPTHLATIQLFHTPTGEPLAVMDDRFITEMRTAAVSALATGLLVPPDAKILAILGSGVQAQAHLDTLRELRNFEVIKVWSPTAEHCVRFARDNGIAVAESPEAALREADVIVTVTASAEALVRSAWLKAGAYINAVGAVGAERRELDSETMNATLVVESREAAMQEAGEIIQSGCPIHAKLGELLASSGSAAERLRANGRVVFKSLGIAVEDVAAAHLVYRLLDANPKT